MTGHPGRFLAAWVGVTTVGYALAGEVHLQEWAPTEAFHPEDVSPLATLVGFVLGAISGTLVGGAQWLVLRRRFAVPRRWIGLTALGVGLAHASNDLVPYRPLDLAPFLALQGIVLGLVQLPALRGVFVRPGAWAAAVAVAWTAGWLAGSRVTDAVYPDPAAMLLLGNGTTGLVAGLVTGLALAGPAGVDRRPARA